MSDKIEIIYSPGNENIIADGSCVEFNLNDEASKLREGLSVEFSEIVNTHGASFWMTKTFERNTLQSMLFEDLCFIFSVLSISNTAQRVKVSTSRVSVYLFFKNTAEMVWKDRVKFLCKRVCGRLRSILLNYRFLMMGVYRLLTSHRGYVRLEGGSYIVQTWVTDKSISHNGFKDPYFPGLKQFYESEGERVKTLCMIYSTKNYRSLVAKLRKYESAIFISDFLKIYDFPRACWNNLKRKMLTKKIGDIVLNGQSIRDVVVEYLLLEICEEADLVYIFSSRLKHIENLTVVVNHENMVAEKALVLGRRKSQADFKIYGAFHSSKPQNLLCLDYCSDEELRVSLTPDKILFNSNTYLEYFLMKYPSLESNIYQGFAFKQSESTVVNSGGEVDRSRILVLLPGLKTQVDFFLGMLKELDLDGNKLVFRMHPMCDVSAELNKEPGWVIDQSDISLKYAVNLSYKVLSMYSSAALESALLGKHVGMLYDKRKLMLNPFDDTGIENTVMISSSSELQEFMNQDVKQGFKHDNFFFMDKELLRGFL